MTTEEQSPAAAAHAERLVDLAHAADRRLGKGTVVDSYFGDHEPELHALPEATAEIRAELVELTHRAAEDRSGSDPGMALHDIEVTASALAVLLLVNEDPDAVPYDEAVQAILGTPLSVPSPSTLDVMRDELLAALGELGFAGSWPAPLQDWREATSVGAEDYLARLRREAEAFRARLVDDILVHVVGDDRTSRELLERSLVEWRAVDTAESWSAYHYYKGGYRSVVDINRAQVFERDSASPFASHEVYPGHHTQSIVREFLFRRGELGLHGTLAIINAPGNVLSEGIGDYARQLLDLPVGVDERAALLADRLSTGWRHALGVALHRNEVTFDEACDELCQRMGVPLDRARRAMQFAVDWKYYFPSYFIGYERVSELVKANGKSVFRDLYTRDSLEGIGNLCDSPPRSAGAL